MVKKMKAKKSKKQLLAEAKLEHEKFLKKLGYTGKLKGKSVNEIPNYKTESKVPNTSDTIGIGNKLPRSIYTGDEIMGIATTHKSNMVPIRKDNKQAAIDVANMRR